MKHTLNILQISSSSEIQFEYYYEDTLFNCSYLSLSNRSPKSNCWNSCTLKDIDRNNLKPVLNILHNKICFFSCFIRHRANKIIVWNCKMLLLWPAATKTRFGQLSIWVYLIKYFIRMWECPIGIRRWFKIWNAF